MNKQIFANRELLNRKGADMIVSLLAAKPDANLGLATGSSPIGIYRELVNCYNQGLVTFNQANTFNLDEYVGISEYHPQSYHAYMQEHLFRDVNCPENNIHIPNGNAPDLLEECGKYDQLIQQADQIDLQILGIGHNGHIGFNEPAHSLIKGTHLVELKEETRLANARFFHSLQEVPTHAITMGIGAIMKAKSILLVICGSEKAQIAYDALSGPITTECPASLLQIHPNLTVILDLEAGRLLN